MTGPNATDTAPFRVQCVGSFLHAHPAVTFSQGGGGCPACRLREVTGELDALRALLREVEWNAHGYKVGACPMCHRYPAPFAPAGEGGHAPDCRLDAALREG